MMPIFFHLESHLWIVYTLFFNGLLLTLCAQHFSSSFKKLTSSIEATIASSFFLSIAANGLMLLLLDILGFSFENIKFLLPLVSIGLVVLIATVFSKRECNLSFPSFSWFGLALYFFVFIILFYNGGLIEHVTDAWWHMSFANKIAYESSFSLSAPHLNMHNYRYYPPLWHGNLALLKIISGESLFVIWNSVTAWSGAVKVMCFYLLSHGVTRSKQVAFLSALLFVLLPGVGDSYLRVSAWPAHIAYAAFFCSIYLFFNWLNQSKATAENDHFLKFLFANSISIFVSLAVLLIIILFAHKAELLWLFMLLSAYVVAELLYSFYVGERLDKPISLLGMALLLIMLGLVFYVLVGGVEKWKSSFDFVIVYYAPVVLVLMFLAVFIANALNYKASLFKLSIAAFMVATSVMLINWQHFLSLFMPELVASSGGRWESALGIKSYFGEVLKMPGWHLQLREGLLYSGVLSVVVSFVMLFLTKKRVFLFTFSTAYLALMVCASPYLYQWMNEALNYHSVWRISLLIFHPLVYAATLFWFFSQFKNGKKFVSSVVVIALLGLVTYDAKYHFDKELVNLKDKHFSDQRNWSLFYPQKYVYQNSAFKYQSDLTKISELLEPMSVVLSDKASSYYLASSSPVYVINVQIHHGRNHNADWQNLLDKRFGCYIEFPENKDKFERFLFKQKNQADRISYLVLNRDQENKNLRNDCWAFRNHLISENIEPLANKVFSGKYLDLYQFNY